MAGTQSIRQRLDLQATELHTKRDQYLHKGLLGSYRDVKLMLKKIEETVLKLDKIDGVQSISCADGVLEEAAKEDCEESVTMEWPSTPFLQPLEYRWDVIGRKARLSIGLVRHETVQCDLSEHRVCILCDVGSLNLPLPFNIDVPSQSPAIRKKRCLQVVIVASSSARLAPEALAKDLEKHTWGLIDNFISPELADSLRIDILDLWKSGHLIPGEIHSGINKAVRSDLHEFVNPCDMPSLARVTREIDLLVAVLYERVPLLSDVHLRRLYPMVAVFPEGARYTSHFDAYNGDTGRVLTVIIYLNPTWTSDDGGELRLYPGRSSNNNCIDVKPLHGRLLAFLCDTINRHEVLECHAPRVAVTFWYEHKEQSTVE